MNNPEIKRIYDKPANRRLKTIALSIIGIGIALMLAMIVFIDSLSQTVFLILRGSAGICACLFVIIVTVLVYRVNKEYIQGRERFGK